MLGLHGTTSNRGVRCGLVVSRFLAMLSNSVKLSVLFEMDSNIIGVACYAYILNKNINATCNNFNDFTELQFI